MGSMQTAGARLSKSPILKRSIVVAGHKTSVSLEEPFWVDLRTIARQSDMTLSELLAEIKKAPRCNLSSAIRVFVLEHWHRQQYQPAEIAQGE